VIAAAGRAASDDFWTDGAGEPQLVTNRTVVEDAQGRRWAFPSRMPTERKNVWWQIAPETFRPAMIASEPDGSPVIRKTVVDYRLSNGGSKTRSHPGALVE
jgi:hypothetical protein